MRPKNIIGKVYPLSGSDTTLTASYQSILTVTIPAADLSGADFFEIEVIGAINVNFGGNGTTLNDVYLRTYLDGSIKDTFTGGKAAVSTYNTNQPISSRLKVAGNTGHTIEVRAALTNTMSGVISYANSRSNCYAKIIGVSDD